MIKEVVIPILDQTTEQVVLAHWLVKVGDTVRQGQAICEIETDKATAEIEATAAGILRKQLIEAGTSIPPLTVIALVGDLDESIPEIDPYYRTNRAREKVEAPRPVQQTVEAAGRSDRIIVSPRAKRMAEEQGIDLAAVQGSGPNGRIIEDDIQRAIEQAAAPNAKIAQAKAERVAESWRTIPHFYTSITIDLSGVVARKTADLTYTDFFALAIAETLKQHPALNAHWKEGGLVISPEIHLGLVVQTERGLLIPVLRELQGRSLQNIAAERARLVEQAHNGKLNAAVMSGATFSLSNIGAGHIDQFTAIISPPQVAILSVGSVQARPLVVGTELLIRPAAIFTLGVDHRAVDGRQVAAFLETLKVALER